MPKEYLECVRSEIKSGKAKDDAQRICAISYYKRHKKTPQEDEATDKKLSAMNDVIAVLYD